MFTGVEGNSTPPVHLFVVYGKYTHRLLIFLCSVNLFRHVKVIQEALLLYRKDGVSINTNHLQLMN